MRSFARSIGHNPSPLVPSAKGLNGYSFVSRRRVDYIAYSPDCSNGETVDTRSVELFPQPVDMVIKGSRAHVWRISQNLLLRYLPTHDMILAEECKELKLRLAELQLPLSSSDLPACAVEDEIGYLQAHFRGIPLRGSVRPSRLRGECKAQIRMVKSH